MQIVLVTCLAACATTPVQPEASPAPRAIQPLPTPTPVPGPETAGVATTPLPGDLSLEPTCPGGLMVGADIDYAAGSGGVPDIVAATQQLRGVQATDVVVVDGTSMAIIRDGHSIWRGDWQPAEPGFILSSTTACAGSGISR